MYTSLVHYSALFYYVVVNTKCHGVYNTNYVELLTSKHYHTTEELWALGRNNETGGANYDVKVQCTCCKTYDNWKSIHPSENKLLQECTTKQEGYEIFPNETVLVLENGIQVEYTGIVHSTSCTGTATSTGNHPYQCSPCHMLITELIPQE